MKKTKSTERLEIIKADFERWYGKKELPKEMFVEVETTDGDSVSVDIAFGKEFATENHWDFVNGWSELVERTLRSAKRRFGYRIVQFYSTTPVNPIVYTQLKNWNI